MQINENAIQEFQKFNIEYISNEKLSNHTTFKIGGMAAMFCKLKTDFEISSAIKICKEFSLKYFILGKGSNVLFKDEGFDGVILNIENVGINFTDETVTVGAGTSLATLCKAVHEKALTGLEFAYGIPGSVGGAVFMNAGAYGGEINDVIFSVKCIAQDGTEKIYDKNELELGY
ncbi:MAG: FAD-binding protein, partial [Oscillospiraceae bacterium]